MPRICSNDARMRIYSFKNRVWHRDTYRAFEGLRMRALDPGGLCDHPGIDWDASWLLRWPLSVNSNSSFFTTFSSFVLSMLASSNLGFDLFSFLMYHTIC